MTQLGCVLPDYQRVFGCRDKLLNKVITTAPVAGEVTPLVSGANVQTKLELTQSFPVVP